MKYHRLKTVDGGFFQVGEDTTKEDIRKAGVDDFVVQYGHHNGPMCLDCQKAECQHCKPNWKLEECPAPATQLGLFEDLP